MKIYPMSTFHHIYANALHLTKHRRRLPDQTYMATEVLDFSSNDYLGLSKRPELIKAAYDAAHQYGVGSTGSRLISGNFPLLEEFEARIAADKGTETALIFNSGYQANQSALATLSCQKHLGKKPILFFDKLNHASLYQAAFSNQAELIRYPHQDLDSLAILLDRHAKQDGKQDRPKFIVTETLFGMDGDISDVKRLGAIAQRFDAFLYLDEAHATGVLGKNGYGLATGLQGLPCVSMGTFSKGLGVSGAYLACSSLLKTYLLNHCPGLIYSTALSPLVIGAAKTAWEMLPQFAAKRQAMLEMANNLRTELRAMGLNTGLSNAQIIPVFMPDIERALALQTKLKKRGILVSVIRPPSVPAHGSRLRIALTTNHTEADLAKLCQAFKTILC